MPRSVRGWYVAASFLLLSTGCSVDKTTGPAGPPTPGSGGPFAGDWVVSWGNIAATGVNCRFPSMILKLQQVGDSVFGTYTSHGLSACVVGGLLYDGYFPGPSGSVVGVATVNGEEFDFGDSYFNVVGHATSQRITGQVTWTVGFQGSGLGSVEALSNWSAQRVPSAPGPSVPYDIQMYPDLLGIVQGEAARIVDTVRSITGAVVATTPQFSTLDTSIASVSMDGVVFGRSSKVGLYSARAGVGNAYAEAVGFDLPGAKVIHVLPSSATVYRNSVVQLSPVLLDAAGDTLAYESPHYASTDSTIASVDQSGLVRSHLKLGTVSIVVSASGVADSVPVAVVSIPGQLSVGPTQAAMIPGDTLQLVVTVIDRAGFPMPSSLVRYASTDSAAVSVSSTGLVTAENVGPAGAIASAAVIVSIDSLVDTTAVVVRAGPRVPALDIAYVQSGEYFDAVAIAPTGAAFIASTFGGQVRRTYLPDASFSTVIADRGNFVSVAINPSGTRALAAADSVDNVGVYDVATGATIASLTTAGEGSPSGVGVSPDGQYFVVGTDGGRLLKYDALTFSLLDTLVGAGASDLTFHPTQPLVYASAGDTVHEVDLNSFTVTRAFANPGVGGTAISPDGTKLYVANANGLQVWDLGSGAIVKSVPIPPARSVAIDPVRQLVYVGLLYESTLVVLDLPTLTPMYRFLGYGSGSIAVDPNTDAVVFTEFSSTVYVLH